MRFGVYYAWGGAVLPKIRGYHLGDPIIEDYSTCGSILGPPYLGKVPYIDMSPYRSSQKYIWLLGTQVDL